MPIIGEIFAPVVGRVVLLMVITTLIHFVATSGKCSLIDGKGSSYWSGTVHLMNSQKQFLGWNNNLKTLVRLIEAG